MTQFQTQLMKFKTECDHTAFRTCRGLIRPAMLGLAGITLALAFSAQAGVYETAVLGDSPVAYYPLDLTNETALDLTGNGNDGAFVNLYPGDSTVAGPSAYIPNGVAFDGLTTYVDLSVGDHPELLNFGGLISIEAWAQAPGGGGNPGGYLIGKGYDNNFSADEIEVRVDSDGGDYYFHGGVFSGTNGDQFAEGGTCDSSWAHVVVTWDGTNWNLYQNGFLQDSEADAFGPPNFADPWRIGDGTRNAANRNFSGNLTQVALYTNALTPRQVLAHYYVGVHGTTNVAPVITVQPLASQIGGIGGTISFSYQAVSLLDMTSQWYKNGVLLPDQTNTTLVLANLQPSDAGAYRVRVSNSAGYVTSDVANLSVGNEGVYGFSPIALTPGSYNEDGIVEASALGRATTATIDAGTNNSGTTFFEQGFYAADPTIGLPPANSTLVDTTLANHSYKLAPSYTTNNAAMIFANSSATLTLTTPTIYSQLSVLEAGAAGSLSYTVTYVNGKTDKGTLRVQDWFTATNSASGNVSKAFGAGGRADVTSRGIDHWSAGTFPYLTAYDIVLTNTAAASSPVSSVALSVNRSFAGRVAVLALSGSNSATANQFQPIAFSGYNQDIVLEAGAQHFSSGAFTTATMDSGLDQDGYTWYEQGFSSTVNWAPGSGLPAAGSTLTNQSRPDRIYKLAPSYAANDVVYLDESTSKTIAPANPSTYWALSFLTASENWSGGSQLFLDYTAHHADSSVETGTFAVPDWELGNGTVAWLANGVVHGEHGDVDAGNGYPSLYSTDVGLTNLSSPVTSIDLSFSSANTDSGTIMVLAVSGAYMNQSHAFGSANRNPDGSLSLQFSGIPGYRYQVQFAASLTKPIQWQPLGTGTADTAGLVLYHDAAAPAHATGFYRMLYLP